MALPNYCRTHNVRICLYIAYIACGSASLNIKTLYFFLTELALSEAATVANIKIRYDAKTPQFAIFGTRVICVFYSITNGSLLPHDCYLQYYLSLFKATFGFILSSPTQLFFDTNSGLIDISIN